MNKQEIAMSIADSSVSSLNSDLSFSNLDEYMELKEKLERRIEEVMKLKDLGSGLDSAVDSGRAADCCGFHDDEPMPKQLLDITNATDATNANAKCCAIS
jgi:hypothetical protein